MNKYKPRGVKGVFLIGNVKHCPETYENFKFHPSQVLLRRKTLSNQNVEFFLLKRSLCSMYISRNLLRFFSTPSPSLLSLCCMLMNSRGGPPSPLLTWFFNKFSK